jgi:hypothetical protein
MIIVPSMPKTNIFPIASTTFNNTFCAPGRKVDYQLLTATMPLPAFAMRP